ncbi:hypothetical protein DFH09DRAFT_1074850 [Mycena vulgaris]|nr:hypothetical protein DFH09DRAFT_1074850 [Mycena vulgaris]
MSYRTKGSTTELRVSYGLSRETLMHIPTLWPQDAARSFLNLDGATYSGVPQSVSRRCSKQTPTSACGVVIRDPDNKLLIGRCQQKSLDFRFLNGALFSRRSVRREDDDSDDSDDPDDPDDGDFEPEPEAERGSQCDHVLKLQVLKRTLDDGGVCATLQAIIDTSNSGLTDADKTRFMDPLITAINGQNNLFFLDNKLNQVKRDEVTAALKGTVPVASVKTAPNEQRVAVNKYLTDSRVKGPSVKLATKLDTLVDKMLTQAETEALANIKSCAGPTAAADEATLHAARAKSKTPTTVVKSAWYNVLKHAKEQSEKSGG